MSIIPLTFIPLTSAPAARQAGLSHLDCGSAALCSFAANSLPENKEPSGLPYSQQVESFLRVHRVSAVEVRPEEFAQMNKTFAVVVHINTDFLGQSGSPGSSSVAEVGQRVWLSGALQRVGG